MTIQAEARADGEDGSGECGPRFGFTVTKKVGNAVVRNRARRRLREAVRLASAALPVKPGHDYVIVGRLEAVRRSFEELGRELVRGLATVHKRGKRRDNARAQAGAHDAVARHADIPGRAAPERIRPEP